jgi:hypothetical protein
MRDEHRVALASVLHPVRHAAESISEHIGIAKNPAATPTADEALRALDLLQAEVARARTLVQRLAERT